MRGLTDTDREAQTVYLAALRQLGPAGRARRVAELSRRARDLAEEGAGLRHPDWPAWRIRCEWIRQALGPTLFREVYGQRDPHDL